MTSYTFPTFCHISDYEGKGYAALHQMIAYSSPLILWSPSGRELQYYCSGDICRVTPDKLIEYVETGYVHVICREEWLDKNHRNKHRWSGAHWSDGFDDRLKSIYEDRKNEGRVRVVEREDGYEVATQLLDERPALLDQACQLAAKGKVPAGPGAKALALIERGERYEAAKEVLRDARNHLHAVELAEAKVPFLLGRDRGFFRLLEAGGPSSVAASRRRNNVYYAAAGAPVPSVTQAQFLELLRDLLQRLERPERVTSLDSFLASSGHEELARWTSLTIEIVGDESPRSVQTFLSNRLVDRIHAGNPKLPWTGEKGLPSRKVDQAAYIGSLIIAVAACILDPSSALNAAALATGIVPIVTGISRQLGIVKPDYTGPQWPFLYLRGRSPRRQEEVRDMEDLLKMYKAR